MKTRVKELGKEATKIQRHRAERKDRLKRLLRHREKAETLRALVATREQRNDGSDEARAEVRQLKTRIRTLEQQIRYIGENVQEYE
jgi:hypothetical protein